MILIGVLALPFMALALFGLVRLVNVALQRLLEWAGRNLWSITAFFLCLAFTAIAHALLTWRFT